MTFEIRDLKAWGQDFGDYTLLGFEDEWTYLYLWNNLSPNAKLWELGLKGGPHDNRKDPFSYPEHWGDENMGYLVGYTSEIHIQRKNSLWDLKCGIWKTKAWLLKKKLTKYKIIQA